MPVIKKSLESKCIIIIQARMGSIRFPGKSFFPFKRKPALKHILNSVLQTAKRENIFVATSERKENLPIVQLCANLKINVFQGDENNVASRFFYIAKQTKANFFIRINGDSPLFDYRGIEQGIKILKQKKYNVDLITTMNGGYPSGMNMEIMNIKTFNEFYPKFKEQGDFEHVTKYFKDKSYKFNIFFMKSNIKNPDMYKFSFDDKEDCKRIIKLFSAMKKQHYQYTLEEKCEMYKKLFLK
ncbi:MAG: hypothetical protein V1781_00105 [Bacteroidota bacterium]